MKFPENLKILVLTISDRASRGEYADKSGQCLIDMVGDFFESINKKYKTDYEIIPDSTKILASRLNNSKDKYNIIFTTGGTGIGPKDITPDTVKPFLDKEIPGIMEMIRTKYGQDKPNALLSRSIAGVMGKSLIYTLPGSTKAVKEYLEEIFKTLEHLIYMQYGIDVHK